MFTGFNFMNTNMFRCYSDVFIVVIKIYLGVAYEFVF